MPATAPIALATLCLVACCAPTQVPPAPGLEPPAPSDASTAPRPPRRSPEDSSPVPDGSAALPAPDASGGGDAAGVPAFPVPPAGGPGAPGALPTGAFRNRVGINFGTNPWTEQELDAIRAVGVRLLRYALAWQYVEREVGRPDWAGLDALVAACGARGLKLILILYPRHPRVDGHAWQDPTRPGWPAFSTYARALAQRAVGKDVLFELGNEPNLGDAGWPVESYARFALGTIAILREANPRAAVVGPALSSYLTATGATWARQLLDHLRASGQAASLFGSLAAWTQHPYVGSNSGALGPDHDYRVRDAAGKRVELYQLQRQVLDAAGGVGIPFAIGERGFSSRADPAQAYAHFGGPDAEATKAAMYQRQNLWGIYREPRAFTVNYVATDTYGSGKAILGTPTETALRTMLDAIGDLTFVRREPPLDGGDVVLLFADGARRAWAAWNRENAAGQVTIAHVGASTVRLIRPDGTATSAPAPGGAVTLTTGPQPVYVVPTR